MSVVTFLRYHLAFLYLTDALVRKEYDYFCSRYICKAFQGSFSGISGSCRKDTDLFIFFFLLHSSCEQIWQNGKCHILECSSLAMIEFQEIRSACMGHRNDFCFLKLGVICSIHAVLHFFLRIICKKCTDDLKCHFFIWSADQFFYFLWKRRDLIRHIKSLIFSNSLNNSLRCRLDIFTASRALILYHLLYTPFHYIYDHIHIRQGTFPQCAACQHGFFWFYKLVA